MFSLKMAVSIEMELKICPKRFGKGEYALYEDKICIIQDIVPTLLGFHTYQIVHIDSGQEFNVGKHFLKPVDVQELHFEECDAIEWDSEFVNSVEAYVV